MGTSKFKTASADEIRRELDDLCILLSIKLDFFTAAKDASRGVQQINMFKQLLQDAPDGLVEERGVELISSHQEIKRSILKELQFKNSWRHVCQEFRQKVKNGEFSATEEGVPLHWLFENIGAIARDQAANDLPRHARLGFGPNRGRAGSGEQILLSDAFTMLRTSEYLFRGLKTAVAAENLKGTSYQDAPASLHNGALNVCSYSRMSLFAFCSFVECFVNGVGMDFALKWPTLSPEKIAMLTGRKPGGGYLTLEAKFEKIPSVISPDNTPRIIATDPKQVRDPFKSYLAVAKPARDSIAHHADGKARIWFSPEAWNVLSTKTAKLALECCREFWRACYPGKNCPDYLENLDFERLCSVADSQIANQARTSLT